MWFIRAALCILALVVPCTAHAQNEAESVAKKIFAIVQEFGMPWGSLERGQKMSSLNPESGGSVLVIAHPVRPGQMQRLVVLFHSEKDPLQISSLNDVGPTGKPTVRLRANSPYTTEQVEAAYVDILKCLDHMGSRQELCPDMKMINALLDKN